MRINIHLAAVSGALILMASGARAGEPSASRSTADVHTWPMFRGDPACTGVSPSPLPDKLHLRWRVGFDEAIVALRRAIELGPDRPEARQYLPGLIAELERARAAR